ncbi:DUF6726 family protein [Paraburkholderia acidisoli]|uniref:Uncharacterized protein n=1 Tax=Paraburkholderia acidisoli TaxID=2571748 RepID=A0A7Z2GPB2_9BURK|nr:hypothetical protein FAZ98_27265 [Paraburkholderia acidisoli]
MTNSLWRKALPARSHSRVPTYLVRASSAIAIACLALPLEGCAAAALPCRLASATLKIVPVVGHAASVPFDACASAID